jgi:hypothetical protein
MGKRGKRKSGKDRLGGLNIRQVQRIPKTIPVSERILTVGGTVFN